MLLSCGHIEPRGICENGGDCRNWKCAPSGRSPPASFYPAECTLEAQAFVRSRTTMSSAEAIPAPAARTVASTQSEMTELILPNDANVLGNLLGGRLMHFIDMTGAMAAYRHARRSEEHTSELQSLRHL